MVQDNHNGIQTGNLFPGFRPILLYERRTIRKWPTTRPTPTPNDTELRRILRRLYSGIVGVDDDVDVGGFIRFLFVHFVKKNSRMRHTLVVHLIC